MTIARKSKETRVGMKDGNGINLCSIYLANNPYIYDLKLPNIYVGIVGWIYGTKIDPISILHPLFFEQWSSLHLRKCFFPHLYRMVYNISLIYMSLIYNYMKGEKKIC